MKEHKITVHMISFTLFRVQITIHPSLWVMLILLGWLFVGFSTGLERVALFSVALFFCLLIHEMGHAVVGRYLGGGQPEVLLAWLGGDCCNETARLTRLQGVLMTLAGPLSSLLPVLIIAAILSCSLGSFSEGVSETLDFITGHASGRLAELFPPMMLVFAIYLVQVCVCWSLLNLLPVFPLDGGQVMHGLMNSAQSMHRISLLFACVFALCFVLLGSLWMGLIMSTLAILNYCCMRAPID